MPPLTDVNNQRNEHSEAAIQASLKTYGLKIGKGDRRFTGAAKLGLSAYLDGEWLTCSTQASLFKTVCQYLESKGVTVAGVERFLNCGTRTTQAGKKNTSKRDPEFEEAIELLERIDSVEDGFRKTNDRLRLLPYTSQLTETHMIIAIEDLKGNFFAVRTLGEIVPDHEMSDDDTARKIKAAIESPSSVSQSWLRSQEGN